MPVYLRRVHPSVIFWIFLLSTVGFVLYYAKTSTDINDAVYREESSSSEETEAPTRHAQISSQRFTTHSRNNIYKGKVLQVPNYEGDPLPTQTRVFYNRMPKCGSRTVSDIMTNISRENNFVLIPLPDTRWTDRLHLKEFVQSFEELPERVVATKHFHYLNFTKYNSVNPIYINLIRDPMSVLMSNFYTEQQKCEDCDKKMTYDDCVGKRLAQCTADHRLVKYLPFLCGHDDVCRTLSADAAQLAKHNVMKNYMFVGINEDMRGFFQALEYLLPSYFKNSVNVYDYYYEIGHEKYTSNRPPPKPETVAYIKERISHSIDFYKWARAYFHDYKNSLIKAGKISDK